MKILITGTTRGIGREIYELLKEGNDITAINRRACENSVVCNLEDMTQVSELCSEIKKEKWDVLINNAGGSYPIPFEDLTIDDIQRRINLNFVAPVLLMQAVLPGMQEQKFGRVINISSVTAKTPVPYLHIYGAAKSALDSMTKSLAVYYAENNICINSICPGSVDTESSALGRSVISSYKYNKTEQYQETMKSQNGLGRMLVPSEVAKLVEFLLSPSGDCICGQTINVCGIMELN